MSWTSSVRQVVPPDACDAIGIAPQGWGRRHLHPVIIDIVITIDIVHNSYSYNNSYYE